jgi:integrase
MKFTQKTIDALTLPEGKNDHIEWSDELPGFGVRLRQGGSRHWIYQFKLGDKHRRITVAAVSAIKLHKARKTVGELHARVRLGFDPAGEKAERRGRAAETVEAVLKRYLLRKRGEMKTRSYREVERHLLKHCASLHGLRLAAVDRRAVAIRLNEIRDGSGVVAANRARSSLSAFFTWAMRQGLADSNPVVGTEQADEGGARDRVLSDSEIREIWAALGDDDYGAIVRLLMFTGQRRAEIGSLRWSECEFTNEPFIRLPPERTKNAREHVVPLSRQAAAILRARPKRLARGGSLRDYVFGTERGFFGYGGARSALDRRINEARNAAGTKPGKPWRLHDLRRTVATNMAEIGVQPHIIEAVLNHVSGHKSGVAGIYNRATYDIEKREALTRWARHLVAIVKGTGR